AGVIGWPIAHSLSPAMHNAAFAALGLDWCYVPFAVPPERLAEAVRGLHALGVRGVNATVPHKEALLPLVNALTPEAEAIGAVNTLLFRAEGILGHNTDAAGFLRALHEAGFDPSGCTALVFGAGGAARSVVYALATVGARVILLNRTVERAEALAAALRERLPKADLSTGPLTPEGIERHLPVDLIVNATTLGMWPQVEASPWPARLPFPKSAFCYDLVYTPRETHFMHQARAAGAQAASGLGMLVHQGAESFALWTGIQPPVEVMRAACEQALGGM
ncbi:MAG: shikimate dehydrogenase, partial [Chloroflexi bacterium]|nr:shikimate dehydrogenase [Chloroflexota bacterium]